MPPASGPRMELGSGNDANDADAGQNLLEFAMIYTCRLIIDADNATRSLGENDMKGDISVLHHPLYYHLS